MSLIHEPLELRSVRLASRLVAAPTATGTSDPRGLPTEKGLAYYGAIAGSGVGLAIVEHHAVCPEGRVRLAQYLLDRDETVEGHRAVASLFEARACPPSSRSTTVAAPSTAKSFSTSTASSPWRLRPCLILPCLMSVPGP